MMPGDAAKTKKTLKTHIQENYSTGTGIVVSGPRIGVSRER